MNMLTYAKTESNSLYLAPRTAQLAMAATVAIALCLCTPAFAAVTASPNTITFNSQSESKTIQLKSNGNAVSDIGQVKLYVHDHDYDHMLDVQKKDGAITVSPSDMAEIGTYQMVIDTSAGKAYVSVNMPLSDPSPAQLPDEDLKDKSLQKSDATRVMAVSGMEGTPYYVGQQFRLNMSAPADRPYAWTVGGKVVQEGTGPSQFVHTFKKPGKYNVAYVEEVDGQRMVRTNVPLVVVPEEPKNVIAVEGRTKRFEGPEGFDSYVWSVDGDVQARSKDFEHTFDSTGDVEIICVAESAGEGMADRYRVITYDVAVQPSKPTND